jgi:hypothetical protein
MKKIYVLDLWGRGGEIAFHELTKAGYAMTYNNAWSHEGWWEADAIELDRMREKGFKNETGYWHDGQGQYRIGVHQNINTCWFDVWETTEEHINEHPDEEKDEWTKITKDHENGMDAKHDLQCVWSQEEFFHTDCDIREFEEEHEDSERPMTPLLGLYSDEKGSWGYWSIELEEEIDPKRIVYAIAETQFGDMVTDWAYISKDNKIVHFEELEGPEGDTKGMYSTLGWKLDEDKWDKEVPWNEVAVAVKEGEFEFE